MTKKHVIPKRIFLDNGAWYHLLWGMENKEVIKENLEQLSLDLFVKTLGKNIVYELHYTKPYDWFLKEYMRNCESLLCNILSHYGLYELMYWSRRIAPYNAYGFNQYRSVHLYRKILDLAICKYGRNISNMVRINDEVQGEVLSFFQPSYILKDKDDILKQKSSELPSRVCNILADLYRAEVICVLLLMAQQNYRKLCKGGILFLLDVHEVPFYGVQTSDSTSHLVNLYDKRLNFSSIFNEFGISFDDSNEKGACIISMIYNVDHKEKPILFHKGAAFLNGSVNFICQTISIKALHDIYCNYEDLFLTNYGFSCRELLCYLRIISISIITSTQSSLASEFSFINRAYTVGWNFNDHKEEIISTFKENYYDLWDEEYEDSSNLEALFKFLTYNFKEQHRIDLWTRGPSKVIHVFRDDHYLIDLYSIIDLVHYMLKPFASLEGKEGNIKSHLFEQQITKYIIDHYDKSSLVYSREVVNNCKGQSKEIDCAFTISKILYLIEAKSVNVSFGFDKGDPKSLDYRRNKNVEALSEVKSKALFIKNNRTSLNKSIPKDISFIVPIVVTPYPEYIWVNDDEMFLDEEHQIPRIMTIREIILLKSAPIEYLTKQNYSIPM